jgi:HPt (histidine-containing phosphotransfer) domain-containing protein
MIGRKTRVQPIDLASAMDRFDGDLPLFLELLREFLAEMPDRVRSIGEAAARGDGAQLRMLAHGLRGAAGNLGADAVAARAFAIERLGETSRTGGAQGHIEALRLEIARIERFEEEATGATE